MQFLTSVLVTIKNFTIKNITIKNDPIKSYHNPLPPSLPKTLEPFQLTFLQTILCNLTGKAHRKIRSHWWLNQHAVAENGHQFFHRNGIM